MKGIPAVGLLPVCEVPILAHAHDEYLPVESFLSGIQFTKKIIENLGNCWFYKLFYSNFIINSAFPLPFLNMRVPKFSLKKNPSINWQTNLHFTKGYPQSNKKEIPINFTIQKIEISYPLVSRIVMGITYSLLLSSIPMQQKWITKSS